ncbi:hypothetical protein [Oceanisphaera arctica]|uniref:Uncharacterized protein n=1 Tax=Oceanisphaera arctica TaxID=641510 RepID=A0A2P5TK89_9GAMM|nr:hypothetical protein [Oceanisphaera arctica]PPL15535.1 hypothetical protein UN63_12285 [Oceanisphaera arctica]GHA27711.1 hypothetical protein GCM10007082_29920 [Oceanisphaera arctica]
MRHKLALIALITLALGLTYGGGRMLLAGTYQYQTDLFLDDWAAKNQQPEALAWMVAEEAARKANTYYPVANADYLDRLGRIHDWQQINEPIGSEQANASRERAINAYRDAIAVRPNWPFSHNNLATAKLRQGELDDEFKQAMENGFTLGPWRAIAYQQTVYLGLISWHTLNEQERKTVTSAIQHGLTHTGSSQRYMQQLLSQLQRQDLMAGIGNRE